MSNNENVSLLKKINEKKVVKTFNKVMNDLYSAERDVKRAVSYFLEVENVYGAEGLREILEKMGNGGKTTIVEEINKIVSSSKELKGIIVTHKTTQKRGKSRDSK